MQKGYHNFDGWLGFIIGDKIFVDFSKYTFEESISRLKKQILLLNSNNDRTKPALMKEPKIETNINIQILFFTLK